MIIVGNGRVGGGLYRRAQSRSVRVHMVSRTDGHGYIDERPDVPILVCTNAGDLRELIDTIPYDRRPSLIFVQNGMIDPALDETGCGACTRGLLYFAAATRGAEIEPGGSSIFTGPNAQYAVDWFHAIGLEAGVVSPNSFAADMASKLIWNCTFGLLCDVYQTSVGVLVDQHRDEVDQLISELCMVATEGIGCQLDSAQVSTDLCAYSLRIADYRGALKQWEWRNGWFVDSAETLGLSTPIHLELLKRRDPS